MTTTKGADAAKSIIINSVDRSIDVLEYLFKAGRDTSISQISKDLGIYKSTVFRTLATLENRGYVIQNKVTELYSIGPKLYAYGARKHDDVIVESIQPYLQKLSDKYRETISFAVIGKDISGIYECRIITGVESRHNLGLSHSLSAQSECYCSSLGKCLLAFCDNIDLTVFKGAKLQKFTENTITSYAGLVKEIESIRNLGYAFDDEEREIGLFCVGVPVMSSDGHAIGALSISGPLARIKDEDLEEKIETLKLISKEISENVFL